MSDKSASIRWAGAILALWLVISSCGLLKTTRVGDTRSGEQTVELGSANEARVRIEMAAGELKVAGGAAQLMQATFRSNVDEWQPRVSYSVNGSQGDLVVDQQGDGLPVGKEVINEWTIQLNEAVPLDLEIQTGAGVSDLDLSTLNFSALRVEVGAGTTNLDLSGSMEHDVTATITGGLGELSVKLPAEMGVRVNMDTALVSVTANGLVKDEDGYTNQAFGTAPYTLTLDLEAGVGSVELAAP